MTEYENTDQAVHVRTAVITAPDGFSTVAMETADAAKTPADGPAWSLARDELVAVADSDGLTFPSPVVTPPTRAPNWMN